MKNKKMKKKILEVKGSGRRMVYQRGSGYFHTTHKQEDIEKWLKHIDDKSYCGGDISVYEFDRVFNLNSNDWEEDFVDEDVDNFDIDFQESHSNEDYNENEIKDICKFDDRIQNFLDSSKKGVVRKWTCRLSF